MLVMKSIPILNRAALPGLRLAVAVIWTISKAPDCSLGRVCAKTT